MVILWTRTRQTYIIFASKKGGRSRAAQGSIISLVGSQGYAVGQDVMCTAELMAWCVCGAHQSLYVFGMKTYVIWFKNAMERVCMLGGGWAEEMLVDLNKVDILIVDIKHYRSCCPLMGAVGLLSYVCGRCHFASCGYVWGCQEVLWEPQRWTSRTQFKTCWRSRPFSRISPGPS